ncbi:MAG: type III-A CRISPR-associated protein Csm2 [Bacteroidota bacterium]
MSQSKHNSKSSHSFSDEEIQDFLRLDSGQLSGPRIHKLLKKLNDFIGKTGKAMTTNQLRNIYGLSKQIPAEEASLHRLSKLKYKLAYAAGRKDQNQAIVSLMDDLINGVLQTDQDVKSKFQSFQSIMEAIVAYHRFHNPRQSN